MASMRNHTLYFICCREGALALLQQYVSVHGNQISQKLALIAVCGSDLLQDITVTCFAQPPSASTPVSVSPLVKVFTEEMKRIQGELDSVFGVVYFPSTLFRISWRDVLCEQSAAVSEAKTETGAGSGRSGAHKVMSRDIERFLREKVWHC